MRSLRQLLSVCLLLRRLFVYISLICLTVGAVAQHPDQVVAAGGIAEPCATPKSCHPLRQELMRGCLAVLPRGLRTILACTGVI